MISAWRLLSILQPQLPKPWFPGQDFAILGQIRPGTGFALLRGVQATRKFAANGVMGVVGHPFVPYILVLLGLLRSL